MTEKKFGNEFTPEEQFIIRWQFGLGDFRTSLIHTIMMADDKNIELLGLGFPLEVAAYKRYHTDSGWWQKVERRYCEWWNAMKEGDDDDD